MQEDDIIPLLIILLIMSLKSKKRRIRHSAHFRKRMDWDAHAELLINERQFERYHRMSPQSMDKLLSIIGPQLEVDAVKSRNRTGTDPISPRMQITVMTSFMAGYSYLPSMKGIGISKRAFYASV